MIFTKNNRCLFQQSVGFGPAAKKRALFFTMIFALIVFSLAAQDEETDDEENTRPPIDSRWQDSFFETFTKGDTVFNINLGVVFPVAFSAGNVSQYDPVGGTGMLSGSFFLNSHVFTGFGVQGMFVPTIGEHMLYIVPMGPHIGYEWVAGRFEFPLSLMVGWSWEMYLDHLYFGFFAKPQISALYRAFNDWSFGLTAAWWFVPQWGAKTTDDTGAVIKGGDAVGNFLELTLMAQYHF
ncbi:MAG: hypothetical protein LBK61_14420 [Spirochaetaceae bacterium]|jgi:hypothetical protein|nr:hypothetical protein [Spirochaetaceae bacterium]